MQTADHHWAGRRVLVTGAAGFIGSHLVDELVALGACVRAMVHYSSRSDLGSLAELETSRLGEVEIVFSDVGDPSAVRQAVSGMDVVFHLAALVAIPYSYVAPDSFVRTNVIGTLHVLQAVRDLAIARLVHTSTSETYGTALYVPIDEAHPLQGQSPYSASKIGADALAESFYRAFGTPVATIRPFNTYGPRQSARAVIPAITAQLLSGADCLFLGDTRPVRDMTYVEDTVRGFLAVASADACVGSVTNVGTGSGVSVAELAKLIAEMTGRPNIEIVEDPQRMRPERSEVMRLVADVGKARERCGWEPRISLSEGLARTIEYVRDNLHRYETRGYVL